jgi:hypothetical protein
MGSTRLSRRLVILTLLLFAAMGLCPPWISTHRSETTPAGYHLIFNPPKSEWSGVRIDTERLLIQWAVLIALTGALAIRRPGRREDQRGDLLLDTPADDEK